MSESEMDRALARASAATEALAQYVDAGVMPRLEIFSECIALWRMLNRRVEQFRLAHTQQAARELLAQIAREQFVTRQLPPRESGAQESLAPTPASARANVRLYVRAFDRLSVRPNAVPLSSVWLL